MFAVFLFIIISFFFFLFFLFGGGGGGGVLKQVVVTPISLMCPIAKWATPIGGSGGFKACKQVTYNALCTAKRSQLLTINILLLQCIDDDRLMGAQRVQ